jgi:hypothetical protein
VRKVKRKQRDLKARLDREKGRTARLRLAVALLLGALITAVQAGVVALTWEELNQPVLRAVALTPAPVLLMLPFCRTAGRHVAIAFLHLIEAGGAPRRR